jgi:hypothetical protein
VKAEEGGMHAAGGAGECNEATSPLTSSLHLSGRQASLFKPTLPSFLPSFLLSRGGQSLHYNFSFHGIGKNGDLV